ESLIHRHHKISGTQNSSLFAQRLRERLSQGDADVLDRVVLVYLEISICCEVQIEASVMGEQFEHVIKESNPGRNRVTPSSLDLESDTYTGLFSFAVNGCGSHRATCCSKPSSAKAARRALIRRRLCSRDPTVMR